MSDSIYTPRSDKKFGEKYSAANCQPIILQIVSHNEQISSSKFDFQSLLINNVY